MKKLFAMFLVTLFVLSPLCGCGEKNNDSEKTGNTNGNLMAFGLIASAEEWVYYIEHDESDTALYRMRRDGEEKTKLADNAYIYINIYDNKIYYAGRRSDNIKNGIYRMDPDGSNQEKIVAYVSGPVYLKVYDGWVYYLTDSDNKLYKVRVDGTGSTVIDCLPESYRILSVLGVENETIYMYVYEYDDSLSKRMPYGIISVKTDGSDKKDIYTTAKNWAFNDSTKISGIDFMVEENGHIYFCQSDESGSYMYSIKTDGSDFRKLYDEPINVYIASHLNIYDGWIYYVNGERSVCRVKTDGTKKETLQATETSPAFIFIDDDWIYYYDIKIHQGGGFIASGPYSFRIDGKE